VPRTVIVTHVDLDGVGSAAIYTILRGLDLRDVDVVFTVPRSLPKVLRDVTSKQGVENVVVTDLGLNRSNFKEIMEIVRGSVARKIVWFDHHVWDDEWLSELSKVVDLYVDRSTCAAGVVLKYLHDKRVDDSMEKELREFADIVCGVDLWKFHRWECNYLYRYISFMASNDLLMDALRKIVEVLRSKRLREFISRECNDVAEIVVSKELETIRKVFTHVKVVDFGGVKLCVYVKDRRDRMVSTSLIGNALVHRGLCDIAAIARQDIATLSLRSYRCDVRTIAVALGGGGHPRAAGAHLSSSPIKRTLLMLLNELGAKGIVIDSVTKHIVREMSLEVVRKACEPT